MHMYLPKESPRWCKSHKLPGRQQHKRIESSLDPRQTITPKMLKQTGRTLHRLEQQWRQNTEFRMDRRRLIVLIKVTVDWRRMTYGRIEVNGRTHRSVRGNNETCRRRTWDALKNVRLDTLNNLVSNKVSYCRARCPIKRKDTDWATVFQLQHFNGMFVSKYNDVRVVSIFSIGYLWDLGCFKKRLELFGDYINIGFGRFRRWRPFEVAQSYVRVYVVFPRVRKVVEERAGEFAPVYLACMQAFLPQAKFEMELLRLLVLSINGSDGSK